MIKAKLISHSKAKISGVELISIESLSPYFLDAEIEKHGMLSSNSSSNRAIPFNKMVNSNFYIPQDVRKNQKGMQGFEYLKGVEIAEWINLNNDIRKITVKRLLKFQDKTNIHKQHLNRYIAPWSMQKKILTATRDEWQHVMSLRDHEDADPSIQQWAKEIQKVLNNANNPDMLDNTQWHLPYVSKLEISGDMFNETDLLIMSSARCARTSYRLHSGKETTFDDDYALFNKLVGSNPVHATPLTHQGKPCTVWHPTRSPRDWDQGVTRVNKNMTYGSGNFNGFIQFRHWFNQSC